MAIPDLLFIVENNIKMNKTITKKEIKDTFKKLSIKKQSSEKINDWVEKYDQFSSEQNDVWIVADSTTSFINFNPK